MVSKLGFHIIEPRRIRAYDQSVVNSRARVVKVVGGPSELGILGYHHDKNPGAIYIARVYPWDKAISDMYATGATPQQAAETMYSALAGFVHAAGMGWCWWECGPNEPGDVATDWLDIYYSLLIPRLRAANIKSVSYNFSVCHPPLEFWPRLSKSINAIKAAGREWALVGLHQYGLLGSMQDHAQDGNDARVLRHRAIPQLAGVPIVLTEAGLDMPGWQNTNRGVDGYLADLKWLDYELKKDPNVLGVCLYTMDMEPGWEPFRIEGDLAVKLFEYITQQNAGIIEVPPPVPQPEPPPTSTGTIGVKTMASAGQNVRSKPSTVTSTNIVGSIEPGETVFIKSEDAASVGYNQAWIYVIKTANAPVGGWALASLLRR